MAGEGAGGGLGVCGDLRRCRAPLGALRVCVSECVCLHMTKYRRLSLDAIHHSVQTIHPNDLRLSESSLTKVPAIDLIQ